MAKNLKMEVFPSKTVVKAVELHVYQLHSQKIDNLFSVIRGAAWKIRNYNSVGVFEDGKYIYTTEQVNEAIPNADFTIEYLGKKELPVLDNRRIYAELVWHCKHLKLGKNLLVQTTFRSVAIVLKYILKRITLTNLLIN